MDQFLTLYLITVAGALISYMGHCAFDYVDDQSPAITQVLGSFVLSFVPVINVLFTIHCLSLIVHTQLKKVKCRLATMKRSVRH